MSLLRTSSQSRPTVSSSSWTRGSWSSLSVGKNLWKLAKVALEGGGAEVDDVEGRSTPIGGETGAEGPAADFERWAATAWRTAESTGGGSLLRPRLVVRVLWTSLVGARVGRVWEAAGEAATVLARVERADERTGAIMD